MNTARVLILDDEAEVVSGIKRLLDIEGWSCVGTTDPDEALRILAEQEIAVFISDQRMPSMTGLSVLQKACEISPATARILMTAYADIGVVVAAVNDGQIFRFIEKPWDDAELLDMVKAAAGRWRQTKEKDRAVAAALKTTSEYQAINEYLSQIVGQGMTGTIGALQKLIRFKDADLAQHSRRVSRTAVRLAARLGLADEEKTNLKYASIFHDIGKIALLDKIVYKPGMLEKDELMVMKSHPVYGAAILREFGFLDRVAEIVLQHHERFDGTGYPQGLSGGQILLPARILAVADAYDALTADRVYRRGTSRERAISIMREDSGKHFDPEVIECLVAEELSA